MAFQRIDTPLEGLCLFQPDVHGDHRGFFMETYNEESLNTVGLNENFVQDNLSYSRRGILRGLHFQAPPHAQGKLVSVILGEVLDVAVDIRKSSPTYGQAFSVLLSGENHKMMFVPPGFAHGFAVLSEECYFMYKCTNLYNRAAEGGLMWNDPHFGIDWQIDAPKLSEKDTDYPAWADFDSPFA